jgi:hypothetical protein
VANDLHANWKQIAAHAKKLNGKIDDGLYKYFIDDKGDKKRDRDDKYDVTHDAAATDRNVGRADIDAAADRYHMWKDRAFAASTSRWIPRSSRRRTAIMPGRVVLLGTAGVGGSGNVGTPAPAAGGARTGPNSRVPTKALLAE